MPAKATPELSIEGPRATIRLRRPAQHNRIDPADLTVLLGHFERVLAEPAVRVLVVTGTGSRTFSSGYTIEAIGWGALRGEAKKILAHLEQKHTPALRGRVPQERAPPAFH